MVDKSIFPRDKVCGDAIGGRVKNVLKEIDPSLVSALEKFPAKTKSAGWKLVAPNGKEVTVHFINPGYVSRRVDFDHFLYNEVQKAGPISSFEQERIASIEHSEDGVFLQCESGKEYRTKVVVGCDGAHSIVAKKLAGFKLDPSHYSGAVRGYYQNLGGIRDPSLLEILLPEHFLPGYFWIFPLGPDSANVGFGMLSEDISARNIDLKKVFYEIISTVPSLKERFRYARLEGALEGFGLPLGGIRRPVSGNRFLLCGDAASLIDPLNGEGIGNAMLSGHLAAAQVFKCFQTGDFSPAMMKGYDDALNKWLLPELQKKLWMQKAFNRPWLINFLVGLGAKSPRLRDWIGRKL